MDNTFVNFAFAPILQVAWNLTKQLQNYSTTDTLNDSIDKRDSAHSIFDLYVWSVNPPESRKWPVFLRLNSKFFLIISSKFYILYSIVAREIVLAVLRLMCHSWCLQCAELEARGIFLSSVYEIQSATFQQLVVRYVETVAKGFCKLLVVNIWKLTWKDMKQRLVHHRIKLHLKLLRVILALLLLSR